MTDDERNEEKTFWTGTVISVQPRIRLMRSFDQRNHTCPGYNLQIVMDPGPARKVSERRRMTREEEARVDEQVVSRRGDDD